jgi:membrane protein
VNIRPYLEKWKPIRNFIRFFDNIFLPGFENISLLRILMFFIRGLMDSNLTTRASSLAFKFFLAVFPGLIFLITLLPYVPIHGFDIQLLNMLQNIMPEGAFEATRDTFEDLVRNQHNGLLSFGFFFALFLATDGVHAIIIAFNQAGSIIETRGAFKIRLISLLLVFIITLLLLVSIGLIVFSNFIYDYLRAKDWVSDGLVIFALESGKWLITLATFFSAISFIYWLGPDSKMKFRFVSAGSTFATLFSILISLGFAYYVNQFGTYNALYGSIGTVMVVMLWMYFNSIVLLMGFQLNVSLNVLKTQSAI